MTISATLLGIIVTIALIISAIAPICLLILFVRDWRRGKLW